MVDSRPQLNDHRCQWFNGIEWSRVSRFVIVALVFSPLAHAQNTASNPTAPAACPVQFVRFNPSGVSVRIKNVSGKKIVGLVFNAALADATENWKWYHWGFDETRPIREFGWNKLINDGVSKTLSWYREDLDFEHGGGGAFVLTSALFEDGSVWEESHDSASCKYVWHNNHKKSFVRPVLLPLRE
jgi:hypothetical protein